MPTLLADSPEPVQINAPAIPLTSAVADGVIAKMNMPADDSGRRYSGILGVICVGGFSAMVVCSYLFARWRYRAR